jgi:hypothetical protein
MALIKVQSLRVMPHLALHSFPATALHSAKDCSLLGHPRRGSEPFCPVVAHPSRNHLVTIVNKMAEDVASVKQL